MQAAETKDLARLHFEATIAPGERVTLRPLRAELLRLRSLPNRKAVDYAPPIEVPVASVRPFRPMVFSFADTVAKSLELSVAWKRLFLTSVKTGDDELLLDGTTPPLSTLLHINFNACASADQVSIGLWNSGKEPVAFRVTCEGPTVGGPR